MILFQLPVPPEYQRHHRQAGRRPAEVLLQRGHLPHAGHRHRAGGRGGGHYHVRHHALRAFTLVADDTKFIYLDIQTMWGPILVGMQHRRRIYTEEKAKVVASSLHQDDLKKRLIFTWTS